MNLRVNMGIAFVKNIMKIAVCSFVYYSGLLHIYLKRVFLRRKEYPAVIINYHRFVDHFTDIMEMHPSVTHKIDDFKKEINFLTRYFELKPLDELVEHLNKNRKFTKPTIALTVDDGFKDNFELMFPVLKERNIPATIFLSTAVIGTNGRNWYDRLADTLLHTSERELPRNGLFENKAIKIRSMAEKREAYKQIVHRLKDVDITIRRQYLGDIEKKLGSLNSHEPLMLNWDEVRFMARFNVSFGAHTHTHPILTKMPLKDAQNEILRSKQIIEEKLSLPVKHFAYPNGRESDFNEDLRAYCRDIGFCSVSTFVDGNNQTKADIWHLKRIGSESPVGLFAVNVVRAFLTGGS